MAVVSGRGGAGKTTLALNLALALAELGRRVLLVDADMGLASATSLLGLSPGPDVGELIESGGDLDAALLTAPEGISVLDSSAGLEWLLEPAAAELLAELRQRFDEILLDTPAALGTRVVVPLAPVDSVLVVLTPEQTAVTDGFTLIKALSRSDFSGSLGVVVNMGLSDENSEELFRGIAITSGRYAVTELEYLGQVAQDREVTDAAVHERPVLKHAPRCPASLCLRNIAERLLREVPAPPRRHALELTLGLTEPEFAELLLDLEQAYQSRFGRPWRQSMNPELARLAAALSDQRPQLDALRESYEKLAQALTALAPKGAGESSN